jgi:hypothetical protein
MALSGEGVNAVTERLVDHARLDLLALGLPEAGGSCYLARVAWDHLTPGAGVGTWFFQPHWQRYEPAEHGPAGHEHESEPLT